MKILISNCGIEKGMNFSRTFCLSRGLAKQGNDVTLLTAQNGTHIWPFKKEVVDGVTIVSFPDILPARVRRGGFGFVDLILRIIYVLRNDYDIVHADSGFRPVAGMPCWIYKLLRRKPYTCEWWDLNGKGGIFDTRRFIGRYTVGLFDSFMEISDKKIADGVICLSQYLKELCVKMGISEKNITIVHGGADIDAIKPINKEEAKTTLGILEKPLIGFVGINDGEIKDLVPFLQAVPFLKKKYPGFKWFGTGGTLSAGIRQKYGIGDEYLELGWLAPKEYNDYLEGADVLLCLLRDNIVNRARWPNKLGDYLAAGRPIVTSYVGEIVKFAQQYPDTLIIAEWAAEDITKKIEYILQNETWAKALGARCREIAKNDYSWDSQAKKMGAFLQKYNGKLL